MMFDVCWWLTDPKVRSLSAEDRALLMDLLCQMWISPERGVMIGGSIQHPLTKREIIFMVGGDTDDEWLDRLVEADVVYIRQDGAYCNSLMMHDAQVSEARRKAGSKGGKSTMSANRQVEKPIIKATPPVKAKPKDPEGNLFQEDQQPPEEKAAKPKPQKKQYAQSVTMTEAEYKSLTDQFTEPVAQEMIEILSNYKGSKGKKYKSDYRAILSWVVDAYKERQNRYYGSNKEYKRNNPELTATDPTSYEKDL